MDEPALARWTQRLPGCSSFLDNFFRTCGDYPPDVNYLNYARDLRLYSPSNRHIRENLPSLMQGFYEITGTTPEGLAARLDRFGQALGMAPCRSRQEPVSDYHGEVSAFKRGLIERVLHAHEGNRTHAARALGLQRTYLLRLMRQLGITEPPRPTGDGG